MKQAGAAAAAADADVCEAKHQFGGNVRWSDVIQIHIIASTSHRRPKQQAKLQRSKPREVRCLSFLAALLLICHNNISKDRSLLYPNHQQ
jgi:hypothetical protein